jgi:uncharacterized peroxidase-related enzyme
LVWNPGRWWKWSRFSAWYDKKAMPFLSHLALNTDLKDALASDPRIQSALFALHAAIMRGRSRLTVSQRELIAAYVSALNQCEFCVAGHIDNVSGTGLSQEDFQRLLEDIDSAPVRPKLRPLLRFARKLTLHPARVTQQDVDAIFAAGWDEKAYRDTVSVTALLNLANRMASGFGIKAEGQKKHYDEKAVAAISRSWNRPRLQSVADAIDPANK